MDNYDIDADGSMGGSDAHPLNLFDKIKLFIPTFLVLIALAVVVAFGWYFWPKIVLIKAGINTQKTVVVIFPNFVSNGVRTK